MHQHAERAVHAATAFRDAIVHPVKFRGYLVFLGDMRQSGHDEFSSESVCRTMWLNNLARDAACQLAHAGTTLAALALQRPHLHGAEFDDTTAVLQRERAIRKRTVADMCGLHAVHFHG